MAIKVEPLYEAMERCLMSVAVFHADETPQPVLAPGKCETGYLWSFLSNRIMLHIHAKNRSGSTPREFLEGTQGVIEADAFSRYSIIEGPNSRLCRGCMAHVRRRFVEAFATEPERARPALRWIACLYQVESHAREVYADDPQGWQRHHNERS